jgi:hypothetical protein
MQSAKGLLQRLRAGVAAQALRSQATTTWLAIFADGTRGAHGFFA